MKVLICTDLEGVSGIVDWDKHQLGTPVDAWQRELMTGEVNAAIEGAFDAGATRVKVAEGHAAIDIIKMDERATLVPARWPAIPPLQGWDEGFDAHIQIGKHSMAGTPTGVLSHSFNQGVESIHLNDLLVGEIGVAAAMAGDFGFPTVMVSGDTAACDEAKALLGDLETAPVKIGYSCHMADCLHPKAAQRLIKEKVAKALKRLGDFKPFIVPGPVKFVERVREPYSDEYLIKKKSKNKYARIIDNRTIAYTGRNVVEASARRSGLDYTWSYVDMLA